VTGSPPLHRLFGQATSGPEPSLRARQRSRKPRRHPSRQRRKSSEPLDNADNKEDSICAAGGPNPILRLPIQIGLACWL
jgi:hypothetical protein